MTAHQMDLFGDVEAALDEQAAAVVAQELTVGDLTGRRAAFDRVTTTWHGKPVEWVAPHDCSYGLAGTAFRGHKCPHCLQVHATEELLRIGHGVALDRPQTWADPATPGAWTRCDRQRLTASQAACARARDLAVYRCPRCRCWTDQAFVARQAAPYECAGEAAGHDWRLHDGEIEP